MEMIYLIIWIHFIADFILQSDKAAIKKSSDIRYLFLHAVIYGLPFMFINFYYGLVNLILHFFVDMVSSKVTTYFYKNEMRHWFFVAIGFDQAVHLTCLVATLQLLKM